MENKRVMTESRQQGLQISDLILVAVLLAAGAVLKMFVGSVINFFGMKPNFIIAMYCLAILLIRPRLIESVIIGFLAGLVCQFLPGTPYINIVSEVVGAFVMGLLINAPLQAGKTDLKPVVATWASTVVSGSTYTICLFVLMGADASGLVAYVPIVFFTAIINAVIVQVLYIPMKAALKK